MSDVFQKAVHAAELYLIKQGYDIEDVNYKNFFEIIASEKDRLVFVNVIINHHRFDEPEPDREKYEEEAIKFLNKGDYSDVSIRFDNICALIINENRAILRHHTNVIGCDR